MTYLSVLNYIIVIHLWIFNILFSKKVYVHNLSAFSHLIKQCMFREFHKQLESDMQDMLEGFITKLRLGFNNPLNSLGDTGTGQLVGVESTQR